MKKETSMRTQDLAVAIAAVACWLVPGAAGAQVAVMSPAVEEREVRPGEQYHGTIVVQNTTAEPQEARIYQTDYRFVADSGTHYDEPGGQQRSNARWISFSPSRLVIPPRAQAIVTYRVDVPSAPASALAGTYWSIIMAQAVPKGSRESTAPAGAKREVRVGIQTTIRYAVQLVTHIAGSGSSRAEFVRPQVITKAGGAKALTFAFANTGERAYRPQLRLELYSEQGGLVGTVTSTRGLLYPGTSVRQEFDLGAVRPGRYKALVIADTGLDDVFAAQYTLTF
jgi:hypothetical protein